MIQRIQSLYLLLTALLSGLFLNGSFLKFISNAGSEITINFKGIITEAGKQGLILSEKLVPLSALIILIPVFSVVALLLYKKRKTQLKVTLAIIILVLGLIGIAAYYCISVIQSYQVELVPGVKMFLPPVILILLILAYRGISKDEKLVKSYDRLR